MLWRYDGSTESLPFISHPGSTVLLPIRLSTQTYLIQVHGLSPQGWSFCHSVNNPVLDHTQQIDFGEEKFHNRESLEEGVKDRVSCWKEGGQSVILEQSQRIKEESWVDLKRNR